MFGAVWVHFRDALSASKSTGVVLEVNSHTCDPPRETVIDASAEMKEIIETLTASDMAMAPTRVWSTAMATLHRKYGKSASLRVMAKPSAVSFVKNVRRELTGGDVFRAIELEPTSLVSADDARPFLQFSY
ncbi:hypothetical protein PHYSODRAFT_481169, partial [Phytophthora sojae]